MAMPERRLFILAVDGGGFRGLFAADLLRRIEDRWKVDWTGRFGLFAGTSSGAIVAAGLAAGVPVASLVGFYRQHGPAVFRRRLRSGPSGLFASRHDAGVLRARLGEVLPDVGLAEFPVPLLIPVADIAAGRPSVLRSAGLGARVLPASPHRLRDAVLASCAPPTWFDPWTPRGGNPLADGGLWANNPALTAFAEAQLRFQVPADSLRIVSIGTGRSRRYYGADPERGFGRLRDRWTGWGLATGWRRERLVEFSLATQSTATHATLCRVLGDDPAKPRRILRLDFESDDVIRFDDPKAGQELVDHAERVFVRRAREIAAFFEAPPSEPARPPPEPDAPP
ncbi:MAG: patatin-like phospholipase family protein [Acidobacteria bacterium]|nr:patatin-like phospholipase family protein [Acidobacteriota bacterium]